MKELIKKMLLCKCEFEEWGISDVKLLEKNRYLCEMEYRCRKCGRSTFKTMWKDLK